MVPIDEREAVPHQLAAEAFALLPAFNSEPWQIPVGEGRVSRLHLVEDSERVRVLIRRDAARDLRDDGVAADDVASTVVALIRRVSAS